MDINDRNTTLPGIMSGDRQWRRSEEKITAIKGILSNGRSRLIRDREQAQEEEEVIPCTISLLIVFSW